MVATEWAAHSNPLLHDERHSQFPVTGTVPLCYPSLLKRDVVGVSGDDWRYGAVVYGSTVLQHCQPSILDELAGERVL